MSRRAVFFDVDGTLIPRTTSAQHLADLMGHSEVMRELEERYAAGTLSNREAALIDARYWAAWTPVQVRPFLTALPLVDGIAETVSWCRRQRLVPVLATLAWDLVGAHLCERFGFDRSCGTRLEVVDSRFTGLVAAHLDELGKRAFAASVAADLGVGLRDCAAVGDSRSDLPLFAEVGMAIGFNATPAARAAAHRTAGGADLRAVIPVLTDWLDRSRPYRMTGRRGASPSGASGGRPIR